MTTMNRLCAAVSVSAILAGCVFASPGFAAESDSDLTKSLNYPELEVTPRATERLKMEADAERRDRWLTNWPVQLSALSTLAAGLVATGHPEAGASEAAKDNNMWASRAATGVGAGWLGLTIWAAAVYRPYGKAWKEINARSSESKRDQLANERLAEESMSRPAAFARPMRWLSVASNFAASVYVVATSGKEARIVGTLATMLSFTPVLFAPHWLWVYDQQMMYKKKIFGPMGGLMLIPDPESGKITPAWGLALSF